MINQHILSKAIKVSIIIFLTIVLCLLAYGYFNDWNLIKSQNNFASEGINKQSDSVEDLTKEAKETQSSELFNQSNVQSIDTTKGEGIVPSTYDRANNDIYGNNPNGANWTDVLNKDLPPQFRTTLTYEGFSDSTHPLGTANSPYTSGIDGYGYNDSQNYTE